MTRIPNTPLSRSCPAARRQPATNWLRAAALLCCVWCWLGSPSQARGEDDATLSQGLFQRGLDQMKSGSFEQACPAIAESYRLEPLPGTLFTLAECEAKAGLVASAVAHYGDYLEVFSRMAAADQSGQRKRPEIAASRRTALLARVPTLTVRLSDPAAATGMTVFRDQTRLGQPALGVPLPIDPGAHTVRLETGGRPLVTLPIEIREGQHLELTLPVPNDDIARASAPGSPDAKNQPPAGPGAITTTQATAKLSPRSPWPRRLLLGGGGLLLLGGAASYAVAWSKSNTIERAAAGGELYPEDAGNYRTWEWTAVAMGVGGAGLIGAAIYLYLFRPHLTPPSALAAASTARVQVLPAPAAGGFAARVVLTF